MAKLEKEAEPLQFNSLGPPPVWEQQIAFCTCAFDAYMIEHWPVTVMETSLSIFGS